MKILKKAVQQNVTLNRDYYGLAEVEELFATGVLWYLKEGDERTHEYDFCGHSFNEWSSLELDNGDHERELRINLEKGDELKVVLDKYGHYTTVLVKDGKQYFVKL